jgi:hypothetical protein
MKLVIDRSRIEAPAGVRFVLACQLQVSPEETELIKRYAPAHGFGRGTDVWDLIDHPVVFEDADPRDVADREERIKRGCRKLRQQLNRVQAHKGHEEVEY